MSSSDSSDSSFLASSTIMNKSKTLHVCKISSLVSLKVHLKLNVKRHMLMGLDYGILR